jgi:hypothetical protein
LSFHLVQKNFSSVKKIIWIGLGGLLLVRKGFSKASRVAFSADMFLKIKTVCLLDVIPEMLSKLQRFLNLRYWSSGGET